MNHFYQNLFQQKRLQKFYNEHKVIGSDEQNMYLKVLAMAALSINVGLSLLGIKAKEQMQ